jgi:hypothetical protein
MSLVKNLTGVCIGRLTAMKRAGSDGRGNATWLCHCDCGRKKIVTGRSLRSGNTRSCGCYGRQTGRMNTTHGHLKSYHATPEYVAWRGMLARCYQPHNDGFPWYGGKGIRVCKRWRSDFAAFLADVGLKPARRMVFSRKDKDDDYRPGNCEWAIAQSSKSPARPGGANQNRAREVNVLRAPDT